MKATWEGYARTDSAWVQAKDTHTRPHARARASARQGFTYRGRYVHAGEQEEAEKGGYEGQDDHRVTHKLHRCSSFELLALDIAWWWKVQTVSRWLTGVVSGPLKSTEHKIRLKEPRGAQIDPKLRIGKTCGCWSLRRSPWPAQSCAAQLFLALSLFCAL